MDADNAKRSARLLVPKSDSSDDDDEEEEEVQVKKRRAPAKEATVRDESDDSA